MPKISVMSGPIWNRFSEKKNSPNYLTVRRWFQKFEDENVPVSDRPKPTTKATKRNVTKVRAILDKDRRVTVSEVSARLRLLIGTVHKILTSTLGLVVRCARWIPKILTKDQTKSWIFARKDNLHLKSLHSEFFLSHIVTGDETYLHQYEPETDRKSVV